MGLMTAAGLLTQRCDPYGAESQISLLGGMYPESHVGRIMWHCKNPAAARYRMICTGGLYGSRLAADGGVVTAYECPGGHKGQVMPLCTGHRASIGRRQAGLCPACAWPPQARTFTEALERCQVDMRNAMNLGYFKAAARLQAQYEDLAGHMAELTGQGIIHKCPLRLEEVS